MTSLAPVLQGFLTGQMIIERQSSPHTIAAYRDTLRLLLTYAWQATGTAPSQMGLHQLDADLISGFLQHLETGRGNSITTRNTRLAVIHSLFSYAALRAPEHAEIIQRVLAIDAKHTRKTIVCYLNRQEARALLEAPNQATWIGRRDCTLLLLAVETGMRVSELTHLTCSDVHLGDGINAGSYVHCEGKGRKERCTPINGDTVTRVRNWLAERCGGPADPLFPTRKGTRLSTDAVESLISKYHSAATATCPSLAAKNLTPHTLRHTCAMNLLHADVSIETIAMWLGHETLKSVQRYLHADMEIKERALALTTPPDVPAGRYRLEDTDPVLAYLENL